MKWALLLLLFLPAHAACGDRICEDSEIGSCIDCATINRNYVCDSFPDSLPNFDPDCNTTVGQTCYDSLFEYSNGRGNSCYPGNCTEGTGCTTSCGSDEECGSGFCITGTCRKVCDGCNSSSSNYGVYPLSTTVYMGDPTFVSFRVNRYAGGPSVALASEGPCTLEHESTLDVSTGYSVAVVKISGCVFSGLGSVKLTASDAWGVVHFLSYPALVYLQGDMPQGVVGYSSMSGNVGGVPLEVKTWVG